MHRLTEFSLRRPWLTLSILLAITVLLGSGMIYLEPRFGYRVLIGQDHDAVTKMDKLISEYGGGAPAFVAWECGRNHPCSNVLDEASLRMARSLTKTFEQNENVLEVVSPANAPLIVPSENGFDVRYFFEQEELVYDAVALSEYASRDPLWLGEIISDDGRVGVIVIQPPDTSDDTSLALYDLIEETVAVHEAEGFNFHIVGDALSAITVSRELDASMAEVIPLTALVIALVLFGLSRSVVDSLLGFVVIVFSLVWTFGLMGWLGWPQDTIVQILAPLVLIIGVCDAVHFLGRKRDLAESELGLSGSELLISAARSTGKACFVTSLTTAAAFASFVTSGLDSFFRFGLEAAFAAIGCLILTFSLLPILERIVRPRTGVRLHYQSRKWQMSLDAIVAMTKRRAIPLVIASGLIGILGVYQWLANLHVDTDWLSSFGDQSQVTEAVQFFEKHLDGNDTLELELSLPPGQDVSFPGNLEIISNLQEGLEGVDGLGRSQSIVDRLARLNGALHGGDPSFEDLPAKSSESVELLELLSISSPSSVSRWVSLDNTRVRVSSESPLRKQSDWISSLEQSRRIVQGVVPSDWSVMETGALAVRVDWVEEIQKTQLQSFPVAFLIAFALIAIFLRSWKLGLAAMVPTLLPVVVVLGAMGWLGMSLDVARAMIAAVVIGIGVDDAIHLLAHYKVRREEGDTPQAAMSAALQHTGRAIVTTSIALALGFLTLMMSAWQTVATFGFFVALSIVGALVATLLVLPALIFAFAPKEDDPEPTDDTDPPRDRSAWVKTGLVLLPLLVVGTVSLFSVVQDTRPTRSPCWILPKGHVLSLPGAGCSLRLLDQIRWVEDAAGDRQAVSTAGEIDAVLTQVGPEATVGVLRHGEEQVVSLDLLDNTPLQRGVAFGTAVLVALCLMILPLLLLVYSKSRVAGPMAVFYAGMGTIVLATVAGEPSTFLTVAAMAGLVITPAAMAQMGLVFPTESTLVRHTPGLFHAPYAISALLGFIAFSALDRAPVLWPIFVYLLLGLSGLAWLVLLASSTFAVRESPSPSGRSRAGFVVVGGLALPLLVSLPMAWDRGPVTLLATGLWVSALLLPVPIGVAISRFNLFDLGWRVRSIGAQAIYFVATALLAAGLVYLGAVTAGLGLDGTDFGLFFLAAFGCVAGAEVLRRRLFGFLESALSPRTEWLRQLRDESAASMSRLRGEDEISQLLLQVLRDGLSMRAGWVSLRQGEAWAPALSTGLMDPPTQALTELAAEQVRQRTVAYLETDDPSPARTRLMAAQIDLVVHLVHGDQSLGLLLIHLDASRSVLSGFELDFITAVASQAAIALHNTRLADEWASTERGAATARVAVDLVHDVGKDLGWMRGLAQRLADQTRDEPRLHRRSVQLGELADSLVERMKRFVQDATTPREDLPGVVNVDEMIERALRGLGNRYGAERIEVSHDPTLRGVRCHENVGRMLVNLVDNALRASPADQPVRVSARLSSTGWLSVSVVDSGPGIPSELLEHVMEPGFTTRQAEGGLGVGLSVSREMAHALGGELELSLPNEGGVRADIQVPIPEIWRKLSA